MVYLDTLDYPDLEGTHHDGPYKLLISNEGHDSLCPWPSTWDRSRFLCPKLGTREWALHRRVDIYLYIYMYVYLDIDSDVHCMFGCCGP